MLYSKHRSREFSRKNKQGVCMTKVLCSRKKRPHMPARAYTEGNSLSLIAQRLEVRSEEPQDSA